MAKFFGKNNGSRHDWTGERSTSGFVDTCDRGEADLAETTFISKTAAAPHGVAV
jgi:hypothetical protein